MGRIIVIALSTSIVLQLHAYISIATKLNEQQRIIGKANITAWHERRGGRGGREVERNKVSYTGGGKRGEEEATELE